MVSGAGLPVVRARYTLSPCIQAWCDCGLSAPCPTMYRRPSGEWPLFCPKSMACGAPNLTLVLLRHVSPNRLSVGLLMLARGAVQVFEKSRE